LTHNKRRYNSATAPSLWGKNKNNKSNSVVYNTKREEVVLNKFGGEWHKNGCPMGKVVPLLNAYGQTLGN
jgi:hypothetical protein